MTAQEKAAGVLPTPATASKTIYTHILPALQKRCKTDSAAYLNLQERFAKIGRKLSRIHRVRDGQISYVVMRFGESRYFAHLHGASAYLRTVEAIQ
jgi:hypothetical protein